MRAPSIVFSSTGEHDTRQSSGPAAACNKPRRSAGCRLSAEGDVVLDLSPEATGVDAVAGPGSPTRPREGTEATNVNVSKRPPPELPGIDRRLYV